MYFASPDEDEEDDDELEDEPLSDEELQPTSPVAATARPAAPLNFKKSLRE